MHIFLIQVPNNGITYYELACKRPIESRTVNRTTKKSKQTPRMPSNSLTPSKHIQITTSIVVDDNARTTTVVKSKTKATSKQPAKTKAPNAKNAGSTTPAV